MIEEIKFYKEHYKQTICDNEELYYDKMSYILAYEAIDMEKNINVNNSFCFLMCKFIKKIP